MRIAVIILNWNQVRETLAAVRAIAGWRRLNPSIWVVDNASIDGAGNALSEQFPQVHYLFSEINRGFAGGNNLALAEILKTDAEAVLLMNNDAEIDEAGIERMADSLTGHPEIGIIGPVIFQGLENRRAAGGRNIAFHHCTHRLMTQEELNLAARDELLTVDYVPGTVALIRTEVFRKVGLFDDDYFFSGEVADFCERAKQAAYSCAVNVRSEAVHHTNPESMIRSTLYLYYSLRNRFLFVRKFGGRTKQLLLAYWAICGTLMIVKSLAMMQPGSARAAWLALNDGIAGRTGNQNGRFDI